MLALLVTIESRSECPVPYSYSDRAKFTSSLFPSTVTVLCAPSERWRNLGVRNSFGSSRPNKQAREIVSPLFFCVQSVFFFVVLSQHPVAGRISFQLPPLLPPLRNALAFFRVVDDNEIAKTRASPRTRTRTHAPPKCVRRILSSQKCT